MKDMSSNFSKQAFIYFLDMIPLSMKRGWSESKDICGGDAGIPIRSHNHRNRASVVRQSNVRVRVERLHAFAAAEQCLSALNGQRQRSSAHGSHTEGPEFLPCPFSGALEGPLPTLVVERRPPRPTALPMALVSPESIWPLRSCSLLPKLWLECTKEVGFWFDGWHLRIISQAGVA